MNVSNNLCHSIKSKTNVSIQCHNKCIKDEIFCGVHLKSKNKILFNNHVTDNHVTDNHDTDNQENDQIDNKIIYSKEELIEKVSKNSTISVYTLRKSIKNCNLVKFIDTKQTKQNLITSLKKIISKERYYISHQSYIILIQSFFRRWFIYSRYK